MPTHLTTPGYGPCGFVQPQWFTTDTTHLGSVPKRRPFQGLIDGSPRSANSSGGRRRPQPDDDYPPAKFVKTHRHRICSETGRFNQVVESLGTVQKAKKVPIDVLKKCGQTLQAKNSMMRTLFEGRRQTHEDGRPCCVCCVFTIYLISSPCGTEPTMV